MILKFIFFTVAGVYALMVAGLAILNWWVPEFKHSEEAIAAHSTEKHQIIQQASGIHSFQARLKMIERAQKSLDLEFFIYNLDESSRIFTQALIKRAAEGLKIRLLVDFSVPVFQLKPLYARYLKSKGIEVRYYNTTAIYRFVYSQHRSHRKFAIADGREAITGGRNIGNEYFDLDREYNFLDTDIEVRGPIVESMSKSFNLYWDSEFSKEADDINKPLNEEELKVANEFFSEHPEDPGILAHVMKKGGEEALRRPAHECNDISFISDFPGHGESNRKVFAAIVDEMKNAKREVIAESPYFVIRRDGYKVMEKLVDSGVRLRVLTNSLYSTDAFYTVAAFLLRMKWIARSNIEVYAYDGSPPEGLEGRWGVHSKRAVVDGTTVLVGTYNIDPRSANLNSELMVVCRGQKTFADEMLKDISARTERSAKVIGGGDWHTLPVLKRATLKQLVLTVLVMPASGLFDFLL